MSLFDKLNLIGFFLLVSFSGKPRRLSWKERIFEDVDIWKVGEFWILFCISGCMVLLCISCNYCTLHGWIVIPPVPLILTTITFFPSKVKKHAP